MAGVQLNIPTVVNNFNVYRDGNVLVGLTDEIKLPDLQLMTETVNGAGILGEIEESIMGHFSSTTMDINFRMLCDDMFNFIDPTKVIDLNLRASRQTLKSGDGAVVYGGMRIAVRGKVKNFTPGSLKLHSTMGSAVSLELTYILIEFNGETKFELDKLNGVLVVNGKDLMEEVRKYC